MPLTKSQLERIELLRESIWATAQVKVSQLEKFRRKLQKVEAPLELHQFFLTHNWDSGIAPLDLIVKHPQCD